MQESNSIVKAGRIKELQKELKIETDKRVDAESQLKASRQDYISATEELADSRRELNESQSMHMTAEQQVILMGQEAKHDLSATEDTVTKLEAQLEAELDKLTAITKAQKQSEDGLNASIEMQTQLKKEHKSQEGELRRELELQTEARVRTIQTEYENLTSSQRKLSQSREQQISEELATADQNISRTQERTTLLRQELDTTQNEINQLSQDLRRTYAEKEQVEHDATQEKSRFSSEVQKIKDEKEELGTKLMKMDVEAKYYRGRSANKAGFTNARAQQHDGSTNSRSQASPCTSRTPNSGNKCNISIMRSRSNMGSQHTTYAANEKMAGHLTWLVHNDSRGETPVSGFILAGTDDVQTIEFSYDADGTVQCQYREYEEKEFQAELNNGVLSAQTEAEL